MPAAKLSLSGAPSVPEPLSELVQEADASNPPLAAMPHASFAVRFCTHREIKLEDYEEALFQRALYPLARWLQPLLRIWPDFFSADRAFIGMVGRATNMRDVEAALVDFADHRGRHRFLRKRLKLRVSASTIWMFANRFLKNEPAAPGLMRSNSQPPFPTRVSAWGESARVVGASNTAAARVSRAAEEAELARLRDEVTRLSAQCDLLKRAMGLFCETKTPPPSLT